MLEGKTRHLEESVPWRLRDGSPPMGSRGEVPVEDLVDEETEAFLLMNT